MGDDEQIAPVEQAVRDLGTGLQLVKDEQAYLVVRERIHRNSESSVLLEPNWPRRMVDRVRIKWGKADKIV
jgi:hypothetical protein